MISRTDTYPRCVGPRSVIALTIAGLLGLLSAQGQTSSVNLKVAAVQFRSSLDINDNSERITKSLMQLAAEGVQVAVFPECALTGYYQGPDMPTPEYEIVAAEERLRQTCRNRKISVVFGSVHKVNGHAYDTAVVFNSHGDLVERYGKIYLADEKWAVRGNHIAYFELEGIPSTVIICHDERYPELVRLPAIEGARVVYYISSESPLKEESKIAPYRAQMMARAVENSVFVVNANAPANSDLTGSHGQSRIIDIDGNVLREASIFGEDVLIWTLSIKPERSAWPTNSLKSPTADWWRSGVDWMMKNRKRQLE
ncbi:MAG TPA: carbon-nitrogen hydrolase family protein [Candidatus Dormibacteraeota bacterium]|nr:carbon-nitrogen hydrolase family protein [Candidatus Dormibacteraeota bacterium]